MPLRFSSIMVLAFLGLLASVPCFAAETLHPVEDREVAQAGRGWLVNPAGSGDGSLQQVDAVSPVIVGDGQQDQGWGYLLPFQPTASFAEAASQEDASVTLEVSTDKVVGQGAHADIKLYLLTTSLAPSRFVVFQAYNPATDAPVHEQVIGGQAGESVFTFEVGDMLRDAGGLASGRIAYFMLACDPIAEANGQGGHLEFISEGPGRPSLSLD